jgi:ATP-dependent Clp protease ATP-binding subunit ClpA
MINCYVQNKNKIAIKEGEEILINSKIFTNTLFVENFQTFQNEPEKYKNLLIYFKKRLNFDMELPFYTNKDYEKSIELLSTIVKNKLDITFSEELVCSVSILNKFYKSFDIKESEQNTLDLLTVFLYLEERLNVFNIFKGCNETLVLFLKDNAFENTVKNHNFETEKEVADYLVGSFEEHMNKVHSILKKFTNDDVIEDYLKKIDIKEYSADNFYFRKNELDDIIYKLFKMNNNNIFLHGQKGVGKRKLIYSLPHYVKKEKVKYMRKTEFYDLNIVALLQFQEKNYPEKSEEQELIMTLFSIFDTLKDKKDCVVIIDLYNLYITNDKGMPKENYFYLLYDYLVDFIQQYPHINLILISDNEVLPNDIFENDIFGSKLISMPNNEELKKILMLNKKMYEVFFNMKISEENIDYIMNLIPGNHVENINSYLNFIDTILAKAILHTNNKTVSNDDIKYYYELNQNSVIIQKDLMDIAEELKETVFGQDKIIDEIMNKFEIYKSGLKEKNKPIASFMFAGNSGTGKTELARQLSKSLGLKLIRFDMSEFQEGHSVSKILGSPAGYVGFETGSSMIKEFKKFPNSILLLDEIEKAHHNVIKLFLQVLEEAELKGSSGEKADFSNMIILFTTNAGAKSHSDKQTGFLLPTEQKRNFDEIKKSFPIEFINRLDGVMYFNELEKNTIEKIIFKEIRKFLDLLNDKAVLELSETAKNYLIEEGFDKELGARKVKRTIEKELKLLVAKEVNKNKNRMFKKVFIDYNENKFSVTLN